MRWHRLFLPAAGLLAGALAATPGAQDLQSRLHEPTVRQLEVARLRAHFDSVEDELRRPTSLPLTHAQQTSRATLIGWLGEYRDAGTFPRNDRFADGATPFFRDSDGALCAMAYLIERSGRGDIVDRVASTRNNAFIAELAGDPALRAWLDSAGLSVAEAARIQPSYEFEEPGDDVGGDYALASVLISGASLTTIGLNLVAPSRPSGWAGVAAGTLGAIAGIANLDGNDGTRKVAVANMVIGGGALAVGLYRLLEPGRRNAALSSPSAGIEDDMAVSPVVIPGAAGPRLGLAMHTTF